MSVRFYLSISNRKDDNIPYEVDISRELFDKKLGPNPQGLTWDYFVMKCNNGMPLIVTNEDSPVSMDNIAFFEKLFGAPITISSKDNEHPRTELCINFPPRVTSENPMSRDASFSHNFVLPRDPYKVMPMLRALHDLSEHKFLIFFSPLSGTPKILIVVEAGSPLAPEGIDYWNDIFMGELTN